MAISKKLLEIICCPVCKGSLMEDQSGKFLICNNCKVKYPIKDSIPILLIEEGIKLEQQDET